jgi:diadenosine tetraphosphate (Ap4A) HIT family hydrolase
VPNCLPCDLEDADAGDVVFRDHLWAAEVAPGYEVPGWIFLRTRRHAERITGLTSKELDGYGRRTRDLVAALGAVLHVEVTYQLVFGESFPHFHVLIVPRGDAVPADRRNGEILLLRPQWRDPGAARALVPALRAAYQHAAREHLR